MAVSFLCFVTLLGAFSYGVAVERLRLFPYKYISQIQETLTWTQDHVINDLAWYYRPRTRPNRSYLPESTDQHLYLITAMGPDHTPVLKVVDMNGATLHSWAVDWFDIWPDATHLSDKEIPKSKPGAHIQGAVLLEDGDIIFNYSKKGTIRMSMCGDVRWKLPYQTHHSIHFDGEQTLWIPALNIHNTKLAEFPLHIPPVADEMIMRVSLEGQVLEQVSVFKLLADSDLRGLLQMQGNAISDKIRGDTDVLHLNDVEPFPVDMEEGFFKHGDVAISLRNINTIAVFDSSNWQLKLLKVGGFVRQHDPDFIDGNTLMIYDNNNIAHEDFGQHSRILLLDGPSNTLTEFYTGSEENPFYSKIMGTQQQLENGDLLITESIQGRAFEIDRNKNITWEYFNVVDEGVVGLLEEVQRLPDSYADLFTGTQCSTNE